MARPALQLHRRLTGKAQRSNGFERPFRWPFEGIPVFAEIALSILGSLAAGILIGLEREFRSRPAGLRTHTLVSVASALLMIAAVRQSEWVALFIPGEGVVTDPTRMAHGILTGIGFLCAGVIFREGFSVQGLTTAASLWMASILGLLFGVGMYALAAGGTVVTLVVLVGFRLLYRYLPRRVPAELIVRSSREAGLTGETIREALATLGLASNYASLRRSELADRVEHDIHISAHTDVNLDQLASTLDGLPGVTGYEILCRLEGDIVFQLKRPARQPPQPSHG